MLIPLLITTVAAAVVVVVWLWRATATAEALCAAPHRLGIGWTVGGWFCPAVDLPCGLSRPSSRY